jgi:hypothetical protein
MGCCWGPLVGSVGESQLRPLGYWSKALFPSIDNYPFEKQILSWTPVAHACNPSYSEGRDQQEDRGSKQPGQIVYETLS